MSTVANAVETLPVDLGDRAYSIVIGHDLSSRLHDGLEARRASGRAVALVTDESVAHAQAGFIQRTLGDLPRCILPPGETTKSLDHLGTVLDFLADARLDRSATLIALGGGVIGDLGGFAAASYLRGIDFIQVPTTLLAMVDSSVGGKTGINLRAGKNLVGAFYQPRAVFADLNTLITLPPREFSAGMAEVIKTSLLADSDLYNQLLQLDEPLNAEHPALAGVVRRCCMIKADVVRADEREEARSGGRALLNLGHTFAHAIEAVTGYGEYLHGEAVAVGLVAALKLTRRVYPERLDDDALPQLITLLQAYALPTQLHKALPVEALLDAMSKDKKVRAGQLRFVLLERLGTAVTDGSIERADVVAILEELGATSEPPSP